MFTEEINKIREAEEAADAMRRNAKTDARQMIEAAKSEAKKQQSGHRRRQKSMPPHI